MTDAHCHCHWEVFKDKDFSPSFGFCSYAINNEDWHILKAFDSKIKAYGLHPWCADEALESLESFLENASALGEIGLDYLKNTGIDKKIQQEKFSAQIALAKKKNLPICIHSVGAAKDTLAILDEKFKLRQRQILFHFANFIPDKKIYLEESYFSFSKKSLSQKKPLALLKLLDAKNILIETDSFPAKEDLGFCIESISQIKGIDTKELEEIIDSNFKTFYSL